MAHKIDVVPKIADFPTTKMKVITSCEENNKTITFHFRKQVGITYPKRVATIFISKPRN